MKDERIPKRLLMTCDAVGGVWTYALELARSLGRFGVETALAVMGPGLTSDQRREAGGISNLVVFESGFKLEWMEDPWEDVERSGEWLLELEEFLRPDVVHLNGYAHGVLPWRAPVLVAGHSCVLSWWTAVRREPAPASLRIYRREVTRGLDGADLVVAPSHAMLLSLIRHYGPIPAAKVIPNGRAPALFVPGFKRPVILAAGRIWDEAKNIEALELVAPRLQWPVIVAGEDDSPLGGRDNDKPRGGKPRYRNLRLLGRLSSEELAGWYAQASVYALPARYEPFGLTVLEAALAECALVLGDIPSLRESWDGAALFVPPDDSRPLEDALNMLATDPRLRTALAARARTRALKFTPERMAEGYLAAYRSMCCKRAKSR